MIVRILVTVIALTLVFAGITAFACWALGRELRDEEPKEIA